MKNYFLRTKLKDQFMKKNLFVSLALAGALFVPAISRAQFADNVVSYNSGTGFVPGFTDPTTALGAPSAQTVDPDPDFGGTFPVDPFDPPYLTSQIVSIGAGGSLTLHFDKPIQNSAANPFGIDFIIFGNTGFQIINGDFSGGGITDGSLFGNNTGSTLVKVSADGITWYTLNPALAPTVDGLYPTDGGGNPLIPVNPSLAASSFAGQGLAGIQSLYNGSAGGTGFDLAWAQNTNGDSIFLPSVDYVQIDVISGASEIDAVSAVPEPATGALLFSGVGLLWLQRRKK
jgi:hypothetical protein